MSNISDEENEVHRSCFRPFTREELEVIEKRISKEKEAKSKSKSLPEEEEKKKILNLKMLKRCCRCWKRKKKDVPEDKENNESEEKKESEDDKKDEAEENESEDDDDMSFIAAFPEYALTSSYPLRPEDSSSCHITDPFPVELSGTPIVDLDPYYKNKRTFLVITKDTYKYIIRFSATKSLWLFSPFHQIRRICIFISLHPNFNQIMWCVIIINCCVMCVRRNASIEASEILFTAVYTFEFALKVIAYGFILEPFTYLRDPWNIVDFTVLAFEYLPITADISSLRAVRVFRALKALSILPDLRGMADSITLAARSLSNVMIIVCFTLWFLALLGMQMYMGVLTQKCIKNIPSEVLMNMTEAEIREYRENSTHWYIRTDEDEDEPLVCGNSTWTTQCPEGYTCYKGYGTNPNHGYTSFDNFGWALLSAFRIMTQDAWEQLCRQIIRTEGPWHVFYFILVIFLGFQYLTNLILATVDRAFNDCYDFMEDVEGYAKSPTNESSESRQDEDEYEDSQDGGETNEMDKNPNTLLNSDNDEVHNPINSSSIRERSNVAGQSTENEEENFEPGENKQTNNHQYSPAKPKNDETSDTIQEYLMAESNDKADKVASSTEIDQTSQTVSSSDEVNNIIEECLAIDSNDQAHKDAIFVQPEKKMRLSSPQNFPKLSNTDEVHDVVHECSALEFDKQANMRNEIGTPNGYTSTDRGSTCSKAQKQDYISSRLLGLEPNIEHGHDAEAGVTVEDISSESKSPDALFVKRESKTKKLGLKGFNTKSIRKWNKRCKKSFTQCIDMWCVWDCCNCWRKFQKILHLIVYDAFFELFISLCVILNTVILAMDHHGIDKELEMQLEMGNDIFAIIFAVEVVLKIAALSPKYFVQGKWNMFELFVAVSSIGDILFGLTSALPILRSLRLSIYYRYSTTFFFCCIFSIPLFLIILSLLQQLQHLRKTQEAPLRIFKLARSWPTLNMLIGIILKYLRALGNLAFVLFVILYIFAVVGMELFGESYENNKHKFPNGEIPRWHFCDFTHSFLIVLCVLCGEWIECMWDCMLVSGNTCIPFFLALVIVGNLLLFSLVVAVMMTAFDSSSMVEVEDDAEIIEAVNRFKRLAAFLKRCCRKRQKVNVTPSTESLTDPKDIPSSSVTRGSRTSLKPLLDNFVEEYETQNRGHENIAMSTLKDEESEMKKGMDQEIVESHLNSTPKPQRSTLEDHLTITSSIDHLKNNNTFGDQIEKRDKVGRNDARSDELSISTIIPDDEKVTDAANEKVEETVDNSSDNGKQFQFEEQLVNVAKESEEVKDKVNRDEIEHDKLCGVEEKNKSPVDNKNNAIEINLCCPDICYHCIPWCRGKSSNFWDEWSKVRIKARVILTTKYHILFLRVWVVISSLALTVEDKHMNDRPLLRDSVKYLDLVFELVFAYEMVLKWLSLGFKSFFTNPWQFAYFIIHLFSVISTIGALLDVGTDYLLRSLRALRPLRLFYRIENLNILARSLALAIPAIINIILVCLIFWLIFSIMGVTLFAGKFVACVDANDHKFDHLDVPNETICGLLNYTWKNPKINFDNVGNGFLALFQVATFEGWTEVLANAVDSPQKIGSQPSKENNVYMYIYFIFVIIFVSFFILNLFTSAIIDTFGERRKRSGGRLEKFLTEGNNWYAIALEHINSREPILGSPTPKWKPQRIVNNLVKSTAFNFFLMCVILLDLVTMTLDHYSIETTYHQVLETINIVCVAIYTTESLMKMFALPCFYLRKKRHLFDFAMCLLSIIDIIIAECTDREGIFSPVFLSLVKIARAIRFFRIFGQFKRFHVLIDTLLRPLPILGYTWMFYFLVVFVYAIVGMHFFKNLEYGGALDETFNFGTFYQSMILLFQLSTAAGWDEVLEVFTNKDNCSSSEENCANSSVGMAYLISFVIITHLIIINMFIAVIVDRYHKAKDEEENAVPSDIDYDNFFHDWRKYDPYATKYMDLKDLSDFFHELPQPLVIFKPNKFKIIHMDINIYPEDKMFYMDVLDAVVVDNICYYHGGIDGEVEYKKYTKNKLGQERISTTLWRQREEYCARVIQKAWHRYQSKNQCVIKEYYNSVLQEVDNSMAPEETLS